VKRATTLTTQQNVFISKVSLSNNRRAAKYDASTSLPVGGQVQSSLMPQSTQIMWIPASHGNLLCDNDPADNGVCG
jgi:hypothetical protein